MKRFYLPIIAVICTIAMLSFTNAKKTSARFVCQWFIYDNPNITDPSFDYPVNLSEATTVANYRLASQQEFSLCAGVKKICAICAEVDANGKPILTQTSVIVTDHLKPYFDQPVETLRVPNPSFIREMFNF